MLFFSHKGIKLEVGQKTIMFFFSIYQIDDFWELLGNNL